MGQRQGPVVVEIREPKTSVLLIDLHSERPELAQALDQGVRELGVVLDLDGVDLFAEEGLELGQEGLPLAALLLGGVRVRMDEVEPESPQEQLLTEAWPGPLLFAGGLCELPGFLLGDRTHQRTSPFVTGLIFPQRHVGPARTRLARARC